MCSSKFARRSRRLDRCGYLAPHQSTCCLTTIDYNVIRCVVEAWKIEHSRASPPRTITTEKSRAVQTEAVYDLPFEPLRRWRHAQATARNLPDWALFGDGALRQLVQQHPRATTELRSISGLSAEIVEQYGHELIAVINEATSTEVIDAILACARQLPGELPRSGVAKLLVGSASERVEKYQTHALYSRLAGRSRTDVTLQVDALLKQGDSTAIHTATSLWQISRQSQQTIRPSDRSTDRPLPDSSTAA